MRNERKALLLSIGYGRGHEAAASALAQEFSERGWKAKVLDLCALAKPRMFRMTQRVYRACVRRMPWAWGIAYAQIDATDWAHMLNLPGIAGSMRRLQELLRVEEPDLVVCTYPLYAYMLDALAERGQLKGIPYAVVVTDALRVNSAWVRARAPLICLPDEGSCAHVQRQYGVSPERLRSTGFPVRAGFKPLETRRPPGERGQGLRVVYAAHARLERVRADVLGMVNAWPEVEVTLLAEERETRLRGMLGDAGGHVRYGGTIGSIAEDLRQAHFYIGKAGAATVFECYATQTPVLVNYVLPGQEEGNQQLLMQDGAGTYVESTGEMLQTVERLLEHEAAGWQRMVRAMRTAKRGDGAVRTVNALLQRFFP